MTTIPTSNNDRRQRERPRISMQKVQNSRSYAGPGFVVVLSLGLVTASAFFAATVEAFATPRLPSAHSKMRQSTRIFLEDWVADMIDEELYRQEHRKEYEAAWMEKNKGAVISRLSDGATTEGVYPSQMLADEDREAYAEHKRDERLAFMHPEKYCADRCIATGNCDILEDFYELGPEDVLSFCEECILNFEEPDADGSSSSIECDIPDAFYEKEPPLRP